MAGLAGSIDKVRRREFLFGAGAVCGLGMSNSLFAEGERGRVVVVPDDTCEGTTALPVRWALSELMRPSRKSA